MSVVDYLQARGALSIYPLTDAAASATIDDVGTRNVAGTEMSAGVSRNALGAAGIVPGLATCWQGSASEVRGFQIAAAADATLQLQTYSLGFFFSRAGTVTANLVTLGRQNGWRLLVSGSGVVQAQTGVTGQPSRVNPTAATIDTTHLMGMSYDGYAMQPWLDGEREGFWTRIVGTLASFTNRVVIGGDSAQFSENLKLSCAFIFDRVLLPGEWAEIYAQGRNDSRPTDDAPYSFTADHIPVVAASATDANRCMGCGGARRTLEGKLSQAAPTRHWHPSCYAAQGRWLDSYAAPTAGSSELGWDVYYSRVMDAVMDSYLKRPHTDRVRYMRADGKLMWTGQADTFGQGLYGSMIAGLGVLHRRWGGGPNSPYIGMMKQMMSFLRASQIPPGEVEAGYFSQDNTAATDWQVNHIFTTREAFAGVLAVWDQIDAETRSEWQTTLERAVEGDYNFQGPDAPGAWYANGNIVQNEWGMAAMLYRLTGKETHNEWAQNWLDFVVRPTVGGAPHSSGLASLGMKSYVDGSASDPFLTLAGLLALSNSTGKAYLTEGLVGGPAYLDWNYCAAQHDIAANVFAVTGDPYAEKMMHTFLNTTWPRSNATASAVPGWDGSGSVPAFQSDYRGGSRHNAIEVGLTTHGALHTIRRIGRTDYVTPTVAVAQFPSAEADFVLNTTVQASSYRAVLAYAMSLVDSPYFPPFPETG